MKLTLDIHTRDRVTIIHCHGRITYGREAVHLSEQIGQVLGTSHQVVLDLSGVQIIDSAGLGELVLVLMWAQASDCSIKVAAPSKNVRQLLDLTNLSTVFDIYPTLCDALDSCEASAA